MNMAVRWHGLDSSFGPVDKVPDYEVLQLLVRDLPVFVNVDDAELSYSHCTKEAISVAVGWNCLFIAL